ncbi:lipopolysaccharide transport periplasmic protein LptA [Saccharobesus litoralis]|nr:lipopolysaccharide transport periplasmic protein LptA [Saccharobesus litoralis]
MTLKPLTHLAIRLGLIFSVLLSTASFAEQAADNEQIFIDAEKQSMDLVNNKLTFYGNVQISQGHLQLNADKLEVQRNKGNQSEKLIASGNPVTFNHQLKDGIQIKAHAQQMHYNLTTQVLVLIGQAQINQADSMINGDRIEYDVAKRQLIASSDKASESRVRVVLTPVAKEK